MLTTFQQKIHLNYIFSYVYTYKHLAIIFVRNKIHTVNQYDSN